ncbi:MAG: methylmalonyl Co-A mutase-associated GTPase MeaB [Acidimicrobiia bacterium]
MTPPASGLSSSPKPSAVALADATLQGDRGALARLLTVVENGGEEARVALSALGASTGSAGIIGITGAPGAGKSTLTARIIERVRATDERVAVLAIDPTSPFTGGAILGDRVRMQAHDTDPDVFIRSMATRGHLGGLSRATPQAIAVLEAAGYPWVLVETVGVGQVEVAVARAADTVIVVVNPGWGDGVQASKAGLLEIGDVFVVNKADRDGVSATRRDLESMLSLAGTRAWRPPIIETVATDGTGVDELWAAVTSHQEHLVSTGELVQRRQGRVREELRGIVLERFQAQADAACSGEGFENVVARVDARELDPYAAAEQLLEGTGGNS